ncbi:MAG: hypothetical protein A2X52_00335 [Candidatus Rokubacteria bacterium GWC2_70_16]|nr:MAG: hypothetical protein A2X52_00335 [Candidatus Rokubacteria bacterium GWC2_70_16]OGL14068.1 MAG: hypothetical protein A3K12_06725 [Candidatus Rokubacteria bacterium RIFCSPLOWO2_12_FULL_71_19]
MEKRAILAAVLMAGVLLLYQTLFVGQQEPTPPQTAEKAAPGAAAPAASAPAPAAGAPVPPMPITPVPAAAAPPERAAVVQGPLYRGVVSSSGGALQEWRLDYRGHKPMVVAKLLGPRGLQIERAGAAAAPIAFRLSAEALTLGAGTPQGELVLIGEDGFGLRITNALRFRADTYAIEQVLRVENRHSVAQSADVVLQWTGPVEWPKEQPEKFQGQHATRAVGLVGGAVHRDEVAKLSGFGGDGTWVGLESEWYLAALVAKSPGFKVTTQKNGTTVSVGLRATLPRLEPGQAWEGRVVTYAGPKEYDRLKALGVGLEKTIFFGGFPMPQSYGGLPMEWVAVPILWLMHWFYGFTGNYGVAIILLTVVFKALFFPLTVKSMKSMKGMQAIQPQVNALRAKYKNDAQRVQQETMKLYREHKVNPLGGCLPMVIQIPIFYALYIALSVSVEIQNAPFICFGRLFGMDLWICDLSAQDPTYVLPILMGISMFVQQKMTPVMGDPRQAKMMLMMPVVFTFMFLNLPSGLVLYWTLSNVLQILQQHYMDRSGKVEKAPARVPKKA